MNRRVLKVTSAEPGLWEELSKRIFFSDLATELLVDLGEPYYLSEP